MNGRKRHLLVDTQGLVMKARVHEAGIHDLEGAKLLLGEIDGEYPRMVKVWADSAYQGLTGWLRSRLGWELEVVKHWWTGIRMVARGAGATSDTGWFSGITEEMGG